MNVEEPPSAGAEQYVTLAVSNQFGGAAAALDIGEVESAIGELLVAWGVLRAARSAAL